MENTGTKPVYFTYYTPLHWLKYFTLMDEHKVTKTNPLCLKPGSTPMMSDMHRCNTFYGHIKTNLWIICDCPPSGDCYEVQVLFRCSLVGFYPATIAFEFKPDLQASTSFHIVRFIETHCLTALGRELAPVAPYRPQPLPAWTPEVCYPIVDGLPPEGYHWWFSV